MQFIPYAYLIGWSQLNLWYYGIEYGKKTKTANPENLWKTYFTSSEYVHNIMNINGNPDVIEIRKTFSNSKEAILWEEKIIRRMDMIHKSEWLNKNAAGAIYNTPEKYKEIGKKISTTKKKKFASGELIQHNKGKKMNLSPEIRAKLSKSCKERFSGKEISEETRKKIKLKLIGVPKSEEHRKKLSLANIGKKASPETKEKLRIASTGRKPTEKQLAVLLTPKKHSEETKRKMSEKRKGRKMSSEVYEKYLKDRKNLKINKGKKHYNDGIKNYYCHPNFVPDNYQPGWIK